MQSFIGHDDSNVPCSVVSSPGILPALVPPKSAYGAENVGFRTHFMSTDESTTGSSGTHNFQPPEHGSPQQKWFFYASIRICFSSRELPYQSTHMQPKRSYTILPAPPNIKISIEAQGLVSKHDSESSFSQDSCQAARCDPVKYQRNSLTTPSQALCRAFRRVPQGCISSATNETTQSATLPPQARAHNTNTGATYLHTRHHLYVLHASQQFASDDHQEKKALQQNYSKPQRLLKDTFMAPAHRNKYTQQVENSPDTCQSL